MLLYQRASDGLASCLCLLDFKDITIRQRRNPNPLLPKGDPRSCPISALLMLVMWTGMKTMENREATEKSQESHSLVRTWTRFVGADFDRSRRAAVAQTLLPLAVQAYVLHTVS